MYKASNWIYLGKTKGKGRRGLNYFFSWQSSSLLSISSKKTREERLDMECNRGRNCPYVEGKNIDVYPQKCVCGSSDILKYENSFDEHVVEDIEVRKKVVNFRIHYGRCRRCGRIIRAEESADTQRIRNRLIKHNEELFLFLEYPDIVEPTNNRAERHLRGNVIMRKITFGTRSKQGSKKHQIIMSIIQTGILNKIEPLKLFGALTF